MQPSLDGYHKRFDGVTEILRWIVLRNNKIARRECSLNPDVTSVSRVFANLLMAFDSTTIAQPRPARTVCADAGKARSDDDVRSALRPLRATALCTFGSCCLIGIHLDSEAIIVDAGISESGTHSPPTPRLIGRSRTSAPRMVRVRADVYLFEPSLTTMQSASGTAFLMAEITDVIESCSFHAGMMIRSLDTQIPF